MKITRVAEYDFKKDKSRYCPVCGEFYETQCRCIGPHSLEDLKKGHGFGCKNGHRWSRDIVWNGKDNE
jgi:hypothetical protein